MKLTPAKRIGLGFGLALIFLVALVCASFWSTLRLKDSARAAERALQAVDTANALHKHVEFARVRTSAYLATGEERHLADRRSEARSIGQAVADLRDANRGNAEIQSRLDTLERDLQHETELHDRFAVRRAIRPLTSLELLGWHQEVGRLGAQIHRVIDDRVESVERARLAQNIARARTFASSAMRINGLGGLLGVVIVLTAAFITIRDARIRWWAEAQFEHQASHDVLTGLPNRSLLHKRLEQHIGTTRTAGGSFALLLIDLDGFKQINDSFGHHYGDVVLQHMNPRLKAALQTSDLVARLGGDEFAILLPGATRESAIPIAVGILVDVRRPIEVDGHRLEVGASIGIALFPEHGFDASALLRQADLAMYMAKRSTVGQDVCVADRAISSPCRSVQDAQPVAI